MERRKLHQGPIHPCFLGEGHLDVDCLFEQETNTISQLGFFSNYAQFENPNRSFDEMKMPFLEMLQTGESPAPAFPPFCNLSFQSLLGLKHFKPPPPWDESYLPEITGSNGCSRFQEQPESCLTHDAFEIQISPVKSETMEHQQQHTLSATSADGGANFEGKHHKQSKPVQLKEPPAAAAKGQKRKRVKRTRPSVKNKQEVESQRMTHIAVERNRRRQMNDHLTALRSLMPSSYIRRGDQASIIGGAIDFVKELEQLLQTLQAQKRMRKLELLDQGGGGGCYDTTSTSTSSSDTTTGMLAASSPPATWQCRNMKSQLGELGNCTADGNIIRRSHEFTAEKKSEAVEVGVTVIQNHVNLKVECLRRAGQVVNAIVGLEDVGLTVLHLNITSSEYSVHYSFNLKIEEGCEVVSADGIAVVVHQMFSFINGTT